MKNQDEVFLDKEADDFFNRNIYDFDNLPDAKKELIDNFSSILNTKKINNILEIGCHIGDLLNYCVEKFNAQKGYGIDPSIHAVNEGNRRFNKNCNLVRGVAAQDAVFNNIPKCDLAVVNDVFCWVSRGSILRSIANIDEHISENGYLIIRDFRPNQFIRNKNKHVKDHDVYCHKIIGSHVEIFKQIGNYQVLSSRVFYWNGAMFDNTQLLSKTGEYDQSENCWIDILLQKKWE